MDRRLIAAIYFKGEVAMSPNVVRAYPDPYADRREVSEHHDMVPTQSGAIAKMFEGIFLGIGFLINVAINGKAAFKSGSDATHV